MMIKMFTQHIFILLMLSVLSAASKADPIRKVDGETVDVIHLKLTSGFVTVIGSDDQWISIDGDASLYTIEQKKRVLVIHGKDDGELATSKKGITIALPASKSLRGDLFSASGEFNAVAANLVLSSTSGDITIKEHVGSVDVTTISGDVNATLYSGQHHIQTVSGSVDYSSYNSELNVKSLSGELKINAKGLYRSKVHTASGTILLNVYDESESDIKISTLRGKVGSKFAYLPKNLIVELGANGKLINNLSNANKFKNSGNTYWLGEKDSVDLMVSSHGGEVTLSHDAGLQQGLDFLQLQNSKESISEGLDVLDQTNKKANYLVNKNGEEKVVEVNLTESNASLMLAFEERGGEPNAAEILLNKQDDGIDAVVTRRFVGKTGKTKNIPLSSSETTITLKLKINKKDSDGYEHEIWLDGSRYSFTTRKSILNISANLLEGSASLNVRVEK